MDNRQGFGIEDYNPIIFLHILEEKCNSRDIENLKKILTGQAW